MPKVDGTHIVERLENRIAALEAGDQVSARDIKVLLNDTQREALDAVLKEQDKLREGKRARNEEEKSALGWKSKKEVRLEVFASALASARKNEISAWENKLRDAEVRQARIYFDGLNEAEKNGKNSREAKSWANNELTRAHLGRMDGNLVGHNSVRDKDVFEMEIALRERFKKQATADELKQHELSEEHEKSSRKAAKLRK
jgi:hypothetical protein